VARRVKILAGDIGGTNCRFGRFETESRGRLNLVDSVVFPTAEVQSFAAIFDRIGDQKPGFALAENDRVVVAVPGPVEKGVYARLTNLPWNADLRSIEDKVRKTEVVLINDFVAQGCACRTPVAEKSLLIRPSEGSLGETTAVIGAGTGLGHCSIAPDGRGGYKVFPSEAGHTVFGFYGADEKAYEGFVLDKTQRPFATGDDIVSGSGLSLLHQYLTGETLTPGEVANKIDKESLTSQWFARFYGRASRNYVLSVVPFGGLYISGGVAAKNPFLVDNDVYRAEFVSSPAKKALLETIAIRLLRDELSGLWGAAYYGIWFKA
jgi:glucokinase